MHWLIPFAFGLSENASAVLHDLALPNLSKLLRRLTLVERDDGDALSLSPPHERALAATVGWRGVDGLLPFATRWARRDGLDPGETAWALITPSHWQVGTDHVTMADPTVLELSADESHAAFDAARELFAGDGIALHWGAPGRWYGTAEAFERHATASLDRVIGRNVDTWLKRGRAAQADDGLARSLRRLQSEFQMLLYQHPLNDEREQRGLPTLNSFWLSGCGRAQPYATDPPRIETRLRTPLLADDWAAWAEAWRALDAGPLAEALVVMTRGEPVALTLCGERSAHRWQTAPRSTWRKLGFGAAPTPESVLGAL